MTIGACAYDKLIQLQVGSTHMSAVEIWRSSRMVSRVLALCLGCAIAFTAPVVRAECTAPSCTDARVLMLYTEANGNVYVQLSGTMSNLNCTLTSGFVTLVATGSRFREIYASLLAAQLNRPPGVSTHQ